MTKGRKNDSFNESNWESVFYNSVGSYVQLINIELGKHLNIEPLSNHIRILGGYAFKNSNYRKQGIPIIRISDFSNEKIVLNDCVFYDESKELTKYELKEGDIIIALTGGTIAKLAIVQGGIGKIYLNQRVGKFEVINPEIFLVEYVYWIARSVQSIIKNLAWGAAIPNVSPKQIESLEFPIPDKKTQKGIIDFLNDLKGNCIVDKKEYFDKSIESLIVSLQRNQVLYSEIQNHQNCQLNYLKKLRQQILQDAVQGKLVPQDPNDEPASKLLERIKAEKEQLIKDKKIKKEKPLPEIKPEEIPFEIPENWVWCRLGEVGNFNRGKSKHRPRNDEILFSNGTYPLVQTGDVAQSKKNKFLIETFSSLYNEFGLSQSKLWKKGTFCITIAANIAEVGFLNIDACVPDSVVTFNSISEFDVKYLQYFFQTAKEEIEKYAPATAQKNINLAIIQDLAFSLPPSNEQKRIVEKVEQLMTLCDNLEQTIIQNQKYTQDLLQVALKEALELK